MASNLSPETLQGSTVTGRNGEKIGKVDEVYLDNTDGEPQWVSVKTGLFGSNVSLLPLAQAEVSGDTITVPFDKGLVLDAPHRDPGAELSESDEADLYRYYGITDTGGSAGTMDTSDGEVQGTKESLPDNGSGLPGNPSQQEGLHEEEPHDAMTRSKEELRVGTESRESGRARLRKYVTSETVTRTVPVSHEEVVVERVPIDEAERGRALSGGDLTEEEHEIVLTEERPVVTTETVPVERVRLGTRTVEETATVEADVREEHIDLDADAETAPTASRD